MSVKAEKPKKQKMVGVRLPQCPVSHALSIDTFLRHWLRNIERSLAEHRVVYRTDKTVRLAGMVDYLRHQESTLRSLIESNAKRLHHD